MISIDGISVSFGPVDVLNAISANVEAGTFVGLVGPNGAGKTTLLRAINGAIDPDSGTVAVDGQNVHDLSAKAASRLVATVPQDTSVAFPFPVRDIVAMGRHPYQSRFDRQTTADANAVDRALARTQTEQFADRNIDELSGGERQRVILARALAQETPVLLLDEPTASLDINHQVRTLELVSDLVAEGKTAVAAIHDLNLAAHYCDELLLLADGQMLAAGAPESVLTEEALASAFDTRAVVARHPVTHSVYVTALPERGASRDAHVHVIGGGGTSSRLQYLLSAAGYEVTVGVLNEGDSDLETARLLGLETVVEAPFAPLSDETIAAAREFVREADVTVLADVEIGIGNQPILDLAGAADRLLVVEERPFAERNYAGSAASIAYRDLCAWGAVVTPSDLLGAVDSLVSPQNSV
ncbi:heme ABC transporter ATP-binding protein [Haladaptatus sp. GCM10025707]|uniref:heme ABC transporter ATP-binding protein n=1 Tax=unclassified Haladaptatus TaxID=2622732 RepID=UPI0023E766AA|nr:MULTISPECIES: heme ABC transporter ATP-binding protein [unclassified Haladaptatus]